MSAVSAAPPTHRSNRTPLIILAGVLLALVVAAAVLRPPSYMRGAQGDPENPEPAGTMAVAEMLRDHGVEVNVVRSVSSALAADGNLLAITHPGALTGHQLESLAERSVDTVLIGVSTSVPGFIEEVDVTWVAGEGVTPAECDDPRAGAGPVESDAPLLSAPLVSAPGTHACFPDPGGDRGGDASGNGSGGRMLTWESDNGTKRTAIPEDVLQNATLLEASNAALAMRVLGSSPTLTWLVGSGNDPYGVSDPGEDFSLTWLWAIIGSMFVAVMWWRGPRFGKLTSEPLPVTVNASETTLGRGHLYRRSEDLSHAASALRLGALQRIAPRIGLPPSATSDEVVSRIAAASPATPAAVADLLYGPPPVDAPSLHALALSLDTLENEVDHR